MGGNIPGGNFLVWNFPGGSLMGGNFPGGSFFGEGFSQNLFKRTMSFQFFKGCLPQIFLFHLGVLRSSHRRCSVRKGVFRNFAKFAGKHLCQNLFFNKYYSIYSGICKSFYSYTLVCPKKVGFFFQVEVRMNKNVLSYPKTEKQRNVMSQAINLLTNTCDQIYI